MKAATGIPITINTANKTENIAVETKQRKNKIIPTINAHDSNCLLYTSDAADD